MGLHSQTKNNTAMKVSKKERFVNFVVYAMFVDGQEVTSKEGGERHYNKAYMDRLAETFNSVVGSNVYKVRKTSQVHKVDLAGQVALKQTISNTNIVKLEELKENKQISKDEFIKQMKPVEQYYKQELHKVTLAEVLEEKDKFYNALSANFLDGEVCEDNDVISALDLALQQGRNAKESFKEKANAYFSLKTATGGRKSVSLSKLKLDVVPSAQEYKDSLVKKYRDLAIGFIEDSKNEHIFKKVRLGGKELYSNELIVFALKKMGLYSDYITVDDNLIKNVDNTKNVDQHGYNPYTGSSHVSLINNEKEKKLSYPTGSIETILPAIITKVDKRRGSFISKSNEQLIAEVLASGIQTAKEARTYLRNNGISRNRIDRIDRRIISATKTNAQIKFK